MVPLSVEEVLEVLADLRSVADLRRYFSLGPAAGSTASRAAGSSLSGRAARRKVTATGSRPRTCWLSSA